MLIFRRLTSDDMNSNISSPSVQKARSYFKFFFSFSSLFLVVLFSGCASYPSTFDDDVYVIGSGNLPLGETMTDETSYAHYRESRRNDQDWDYFDDRGVFYQSAFPGYSPFYVMTFYPAWNNWNYHYSNPWNYGYDWDMYYTAGWNPYYGMYMPYSVWCYPYGLGYGGFYSPYFFGTHPTSPGSPSQPNAALVNHHSGPRGSWVSTVNPANRPQSDQALLKTVSQDPVRQRTSFPRTREVNVGNVSIVRTSNRPSRSPLIHSGQRTGNNGNINVRTTRQVDYNYNRYPQRVPSSTHNRPVRYERSGNTPTNRSVPANRPSRPIPSPGRRL